MALVLMLPLTGHAADFRGFASPGPMGVILFQECLGNKPASRVVKVEDETKDGAFSEGLVAVNKIMLNPGRPIYVEFRGQGSGQLIKAQEFQRAVGTFENCAAAEPIAAGVNLWAAGDAWRLTANSSAASFDRPGGRPVRFPVAPFAAKSQDESKETTRTIDAWSSLDGGTVRVEITPGLCSDGRSETAYGATAVLRYGSRTYEGCAARF
jgi:uncharacterized membrane protein